MARFGDLEAAKPDGEESDATLILCPERSKTPLRRISSDPTREHEESREPPKEGDVQSGRRPADGRGVSMEGTGRGTARMIERKWEEKRIDWMLLKTGGLEGVSFRNHP